LVAIRTVVVDAEVNTITVIVIVPPLWLLLLLRYH
jgi:hypothetical protein